MTLTNIPYGIFPPARPNKKPRKIDNQPGRSNTAIGGGEHLLSKIYPEKNASTAHNNAIAKPLIGAIPGKKYNDINPPNIYTPPSQPLTRCQRQINQWLSQRTIFS